MPEQVSQAKGRLISHFESLSTEQKAGSGWSDLWDSGEADLWDRGFPSPPLIDFLEGNQQLLKSAGADGQPKKAFVPACGTGYDPVMLALHGYDAYGLEISSTAVSVARNYAKAQMGEPDAYNWSSANQRQKHQSPAGQVTFIEGDFFKRVWEADLHLQGGGFDLVYDYTFLCALPPDMRKSWAKRMAELVKPGGFLICLEFPLWKDRSAPGPPWGLQGVYTDLLARGGDGLLETDTNQDSSSHGSGDFTREVYWKPIRSYEQSRGADMLSIWRRK